MPLLPEITAPTSGSADVLVHQLLCFTVQHLRFHFTRGRRTLKHGDVAGAAETSWAAVPIQLSAGAGTAAGAVRETL